MNSAWRSRWHHLGGGLRGAEPELWRRRSSSTRGSTCAYVPTAPLIAAHAHDLSRAPQPLPVAVELERQDRELVAEGGRLGVDAVGPPDHHRVAVLAARAASRSPSSRSSRPSSRSAASRSCSASPVSSTSEDVSPKCTHRPSAPTDSADDLDERGDVVAGDRLDARAPARGRTPPVRGSPRRPRRGIMPELGPGLDRRGSRSRSQFAEAGLVGPDGGHLGEACSRGINSWRPSARSSLNFQSACLHVGVADRDDLGGEDGRVHRGVDARRSRPARPWASAP